MLGDGACATHCGFISRVKPAQTRGRASGLFRNILLKDRASYTAAPPDTRDQTRRNLLFGAAGALLLIFSLVLANAWRENRRLLNQVQMDARSRRSGRLPLANALALLNTLIMDLAAFSGMEMENMTRGHGWLFLDFGRRLERGANLHGSLEIDFASAFHPPIGSGKGQSVKNHATHWPIRFSLQLDQLGKARRCNYRRRRIFTRLRAVRHRASPAVEPPLTWLQ